MDDFPATAPASRLQRGGVVLPIHQSESLWISFSAQYPCAVKIAAGKINAVSGEAWTAGDSVEEQLNGRADRADHPAGIRTGISASGYWN